jgi:hypothetical protein
VICPVSVVYNATAQEPCTASVSGPGLSQSLTVSYTDNENVGTAHASASFPTGGNYIGSSDAETFEITRRPVHGAFTVPNKIWDGTTAATITSRSLTDAIAGDDVGLTGGTTAFPTSAVGGPYTLTLVGGTLTGADQGNYTLVLPVTTQASILFAYRTEGFFKPVDMTPSGATKFWNSVKGGSTVPLKFRVFSVLGPEFTSTAGINIRVGTVSCGAGISDPTPIDPVATGGTSLRYSDGQFIFNWTVPKGANNCYLVWVETADGNSTMSGPGDVPASHDAWFKSK